MKFHIRTLGCKMNQLDSARLQAALMGAGHQQVENEEEAEYSFVNSCTVTAQADRKSRKAANAATRSSQLVAVLGCSVRIDAGKWRQALPNALVFDSDEKLLDYFGATDNHALLPVTSRTRMQVAIQTGCDDTCSFCITTLARGDHRSLPTSQIIEQVQEAQRHGVNEIVLTGINLAAWGSPNSKSQPQAARLHELLASLLSETSIPRIRLSSIGPQYLQPEFWEVYNDPRICDYLHLSMQSGSDPVLKAMDRGHGTLELINIAEQARQVRPETALAADLIAGFPGETESNHQQTVALIQTLQLSKLHVFPYSPRLGTLAAELEQLPTDIRKRRATEIRERGQRLRNDFLSSQMSRTLTVLAEENGRGWSSNYIRLHTDDLTEGSIGDIKLSASTLAESLPGSDEDPATMATKVQL